MLEFEVIVKGITAAADMHMRGIDVALFPLIMRSTRMHSGRWDTSGRAHLMFDATSEQPHKFDATIMLCHIGGTV
jgi:hypothetical protein